MSLFVPPHRHDEHHSRHQVPPRVHRRPAGNPMPKGLALVLLSLLLLSKGCLCSADAYASGSPPSHGRIAGDAVALMDAKALLLSAGVSEGNLCRERAPAAGGGEDDAHWAEQLPLCDPSGSDADNSGADAGRRWWKQRRGSRKLEEQITLEGDPWSFFVMASCALACVTTAALAAGLSMGMLSLDPLMLLVKIRASRSPEEKEQAESLLPIVKKHHLLLVTLLLLNSMANEALPLFLDRLVPPYLAVLLSVTFVLIFGEIVPSAIFTGPKKIELASKMVPMVKVVMILVWPITYPIAKILDHLLHAEDEDGESAFDRGEISALVRIQYEERVANKRRRTLGRMASMRASGRDFASAIDSSQEADIEAFAGFSSNRDLMQRQSSGLSSISEARTFRESIHMDEVMMVEGALQMKTKTAYDVLTPIHRMYAVPEDLILNEESIVDIYSSGYSRIPVYERNPSKPKCKDAIKGILSTKNLIVVNSTENRPLRTMPLLTPPCVSPVMNLVELVNLFQTGREGHFALVCTRPRVGTAALGESKPLPAAAGLLGVITLEDVLEELLQEEILDENDLVEKDAKRRIAQWVGTKWKNQKRKRDLRAQGKHASLASVAETMQATNESTSLLGRNGNRREHPRKKNQSILGSIYQTMGLE